jgi:hypothetical protein
VADLVTGAEPSMDMAAFRADRPSLVAVDPAKNW